MKKAIAVFLAVVVVISAAMIGCSKKSKDDTDASQTVGLGGNEDVYDLDGDDESGDEETEVVTDENGETVTNEDGKPVTRKVTKRAKKPSGTTTTMKRKGNEGTTASEVTTKDVKDDKVPTTSAKGDPVEFSAEDQNILKQMLEVPYLYNANYENADGVPTDIASHVAIWMSQRDGLNTTAFASGTIVLDLFKYFGQTVVNFKTKCNDSKGNADITYNTASDTFTIPGGEAERQKVSLTSIEALGNNNYYKVTANVEAAGSISNVVAVVQRNKLDSSLGFSIKALKWS